MKFLIVLSFAVVAALAVPSTVQQWTSFKATHNKKYKNFAEETHRLKIFADNLKQIEDHNKLYGEGKVTYTKGINQFADWTAEEFLAYVNKNKMSARKPATKVHKMSGVKAPADVDWRTSGVVTEVKDQGQCGSSWSFSATGSLEGQYAIHHGNLISLSEQHLVDCSGGYGTSGCDGGYMNNAFIYVIDLGIALESEYPYEAIEGPCRYREDSALTCVSYVDLPSGSAGSEAVVQDAITTIGPVSVTIDATSELQLYSGGIFHDPTCKSDVESLNHGVLAVGYGSDYWLIKNSWGVGWGESGYFRLAREGNHCGLTAAASYPTVA